VGFFYLRPVPIGRGKSLKTMPNHQHLQSRGSEELPPNFKTQRQHILDLLMAAEGGEVPLAEIMVCAAQYNTCIHELRKRGYKIVNRAETRNGVRHSWYRLESSPADLTPRTPRPEPAPSRKKSGRVEPSSTPAPPSQPAQTLSLFPEMATPSVASPQRPVWRDPELDGVKNGSVKHG
jgi:hypothetical protein